MVEKQQEDHVFGYVLEVLTTGLYPNSLDIIREYVQNGYDAIQALRDIGVRGPEEIRIWTEDNSVIIYDTGIGMDKNIVEKYRYFGYSEKITTKNTGFRGIGKLAGLSVAKDLEVVTSRYGVPYQYTVRFLASKMLDKVLKGKQLGINYPLNDLIKEHTIIEEAPEDSNVHYTKVILHNVKDDAKELLDEETIMNHVSQVMPVNFDENVFGVAPVIVEKLKFNLPSYFTIDIYVNNCKVFKSYKDSDDLSGLSFYPVIRKDDNGEEELLAYAWVMKNGQRSGAINNPLIKNIRVNYKGFMIGRHDLITEVLFTPGRQFIASWFAGEVYVLDERLIPTSARDNFENNVARRELYSCLREQIGKNLDKIANKTSQNNSVKKEVETAKKLVEQVERTVQSKEIPKEVLKMKENEIDWQIKKLEKKVSANKSTISTEHAKKAKQLLEDLQTHKTKIIEIKQENNNNLELNFTNGEKQVYEIMLKSIKTFFVKNGIDNEEELIAHAYKKLAKVFGTKATR